VVALLAIAAAVFAFTRLQPDNTDYNGDSEINNFRPPREIEDEMYEAANRLITNNHTLIRLYITHGIPVVREPYANTTDRPLGNPPEDGLFYSGSGDYKTLAAIESIVDSTFTPEEAERIKNNQLDDGSPYYSDFGRIFGEKRANSDGITLGVNEKFALAKHPYPRPNEDYPISWTDVSFDLTALSVYECELRIRLTINGEPGVIVRKMVNYDEQGWRLDGLIHE
jgi:hypothetical protein